MTIRNVSGLGQMSANSFFMANPSQGFLLSIRD